MMGAVLTVHRAAHGSELVDALAALLEQPPADPFTPDLVAVPARGVERWLAQRLSHTLGRENHADGVCANVRFESPGAVLGGALRDASPEHAASLDRWSAAAITWPLLEVLDDCLAADPAPAWSAGLVRYLRDDRRPAGERDTGRRLATAARLARLFEQYGEARPELLRSWAEAHAAAPDDPVPVDLRWQPELWRLVRGRVGPAPAELVEDACRLLRAEPDRSRLPARLSVFGASRLSVVQLLVLAALAEHRDVHLWLNHPSPALWEAARTAPPIDRRAADTTRAELRNPLLASMSRDLLELQHRLRRQIPGAVDVHHPAPPRPDTLLGWLQQDIADDATGRATDAGRALRPDDRSVQVHACHGRVRQVEVLREVVLGLLAGDPTLEARDVLVMCPDIESFAPLIAGAFALGAQEQAPHPAARLRVRLADRALRQTNPLLAVLEQVLQLGAARVSASEVLDLAGLAAVRRRFGFDADDLERLRDWVSGAGIRWGLDAAHREAWQLSGIRQGTWTAGLDRVLLGVAMEGEDALLDGVLPLDDVDSSDVDLAGRLAELVDRLHAAQDLMSSPRTAQDWWDGLQDATSGLAAAGPRDAWQQVQLQQVLADALGPAAAGATLLGLADVRALLADSLAGRPTRASFRTGTLTIATLVPMRSVPHRVICLLGLDDGSFPRQGVPDGDDLLARDPWVGERDPRSEDRQLLLDAVCAAGERLVITYTGADERTGAPVPPAVPLGELLDALDRSAQVAGQPRVGTEVRDAITIRHPLQPFDFRNFSAGALGSPGPFSFDQLAASGALAAGQGRVSQPAFLPGPLPAEPAADLGLADLRRLLQHPARGFLRLRLQVAATLRDEDPSDAMPVELNALEQWDLGERLLRRRLAGIEPARCIELELAGGRLPPGPLGAKLLRTVGGNVERIVRGSQAERSQPAQAQDVDVRLPDGTRLTGTVTGVRGRTLLSVTYSKLAAKHRLLAWLDLLAVSAGRPEHGWQAVVVGRGSQPVAEVSILGPVPDAEAVAAIQELVTLYRAGLREPLPLPLKTAATYAERRRNTRPPTAARLAEPDWVGGKIPGERADPEHVLVHGESAPLGVLLADPPGPDEAGVGWSADEDTRFGRLSRRLWDRLLAAERREQR